ncbi:MAG: hypothetical protein M0R06_15455 [Sphaerochaeta sp.]|nr:hypothetical protein [Sphaerochaeta sp.]
MFKILFTLFSVACFAAADDYKCDPPKITMDGSDRFLEGLKTASTTVFKNVMGYIQFPFNDSISGAMEAVIIYTRSSPQADANYAGLPIGSICYQLEITSTAASGAMVWLKVRSGASGWERMFGGGNIGVYGSDGALKASYATIDLAVAGLANDDILMLKPGEYTLTAAVDITKTGIQIIGEGAVTIIGAAAADYCFKTVFGAISSTKSITFKNITLDHGDDATQQGIRIENTSATGRINVYLDNVSGESDGGDTLHVDHAAAGAAIRLYATGGTYEGPVNFTVKNTDDRIRFEGSTLRGGLVTSADDIAMEILLERCKVLYHGVTGGHASQLLYAMYCLSETDANPNVYHGLLTADLAGSHTESELFPTAS